MKLQSKLDEIVGLVEGARSMPMSASCVVNRADLLGLVADVRRLFPAELQEAQSVLDDRDEILAEGRREAERIIESAHEERAKLVARTEVAARASREAERLLDEARDQTEVMRAEVDDYVDAKLANFEVVLHKTLSAVERGRDKLRGRHELDALAGDGAHDTDGTAAPDRDRDGDREGQISRW